MIYTPPPQSLWVFLEVRPHTHLHGSHFHTIIYTPPPQSLWVFLDVRPSHTTMFTKSHTFHLPACPQIPLPVQPFETAVWLLTFGATCPLPTPHPPHLPHFLSPV